MILASYTRKFSDRSGALLLCSGISDSQYCIRTRFRWSTSWKSSQYIYIFCCKALQSRNLTRLRSELLGGKFLQRCMGCRRGRAMRIMSVCLSVCLTNACIVTKRKKALSRFLYHAYKRAVAQFSEKKNGWWGGDHFYLKFWVNRPPFGVKSPILNRYSLVYRLNHNT